MADERRRDGKYPKEHNSDSPHISVKLNTSKGEKLYFPPLRRSSAAQFSYVALLDLKACKVPMEQHINRILQKVGENNKTQESNFLFVFTAHTCGCFWLFSMSLKDAGSTDTPYNIRTTDLGSEPYLSVSSQQQSLSLGPQPRGREAPTKAKAKLTSLYLYEKSWPDCHVASSCRLGQDVQNEHGKVNDKQADPIVCKPPKTHLVSAHPIFPSDISNALETLVVKSRKSPDILNRSRNRKEH